MGYFCTVLIVKNTEHFRIEKPTILTIGTFDGVHEGHQKLLTRLKDLKSKFGLNTVILTFSPHPRKVLFPEQKDLKLLTTTTEKLDLLEKFGVDVAVVYPFTKEFAQIDAEFYISEVLKKSLKVKHIIIGYDHKFGKNREGDINTLRAFSKKYDYTVEEISALDINSIAVSSSKIRQAIDNGNIKLANAFLGYPYSLSGKVVGGKQLGKTIGFPTANIKVEEEEKLIPKIGVYFVEIDFNGEKYYGMLNIGKNPTTDTDNLVKIEVNIFNFDKAIYDETLNIKFIEYLRDEIKFNSVEELTEQLKRDKKNCLDLIKQLKQ